MELSVGIITDDIKYITCNPRLSLLITMNKKCYFQRTSRDEGLDRSIVCRWIDTERNQSDRYIVGGLNISKSKIGRSVSDAGMHASERSGGRETTLVVFVPRWTCVLTFRARPRQIRCWNAGPLVGGHPMPAESPFPLLAAVSVAGAARIPELRTEIRFVRVPQRQPPCRSHRSHYLYW
ncbi:hypothetical protein DBV15_10539 [Temnothorax longispinosus]|uniref:Uncharacterized protein n=1 Tax=Temnothorax longispinosus TaxID=300112 RepID=A0A4S2L2X8_9HYME|nr:hypothetical protein DBV15_10539 [Temnothorax longispinosus]